MDNLNVVDILKMGLPGLVLLLSVLSYRLLSNEQGNNNPREGVLRSIKQFMYLNFVFAVLTVAAPLIEGKYSTKNEEFTVSAVAEDALDVGKARVCNGADYVDHYLLIHDAETRKMVQVRADGVLPCNGNQVLSINAQDAVKLGWNGGKQGKDVQVVVAMRGYMFPL